LFVLGSASSIISLSALNSGSLVLSQTFGTLSGAAVLNLGTQQLPPGTLELPATIVNNGSVLALAPGTTIVVGGIILHG
jgi:hypothetical protein